MIDLAGTWKLRDVGGEFSCPLTLPGDCLSALIDAEILPDPYYGRNEYDCRWPAERDWIASRSFEATGDGPWLFRVHGLDTVAEVRLNSELIVEAANSFRPHTEDVSDWIREGTNEIEILFKSNPKAGQEIAARQPYPVPHTHNNPVAGGNMLRKVQCDFGWDWGPCLMPFGVLGEISVSDGSDIRIGNVVIHQFHSADGVELQIEAELSGFGNADLQCRFEIDGVVDEGPVLSEPSELGTLFGGLSLKTPKLWWPAGTGQQHLYDLKISVGDVSKTVKVALRDFNLITNEDEVGSVLHSL